MTPFGARLRALRAERGVSLRHLAAALQVSAAYLSALEHGKRGSPSAGLVHQVNEYFGLIWDDADDVARLARLSNPRVTVTTAGLTAEQTALANRLAQMMERLPPETVAALHAVLDTTTPQAQPRVRRPLASQLEASRVDASRLRSLGAAVNRSGAARSGLARLGATRLEEMDLDACLPEARPAGE